MAETIIMPKLGFDMAEGTLVRWVKKVGETVTKGDVLAEIETDKATVEVESSASGVVRSLLVDEGVVVPVNTPIALVGTADEKIEEPVLKKGEDLEQKGKPEVPVPSARPTTVSTVQAGMADIPRSILRVSPLARRMANENDIDLSAVIGSGPGGRIVKRDIEDLLAGKGLPVGEGMAGKVSTSPSQKVMPNDQTLPISKLRAAIGRRMAEAKANIPHFYVSHEYIMEPLLSLRTQYNNIVPEAEKLSVNDFLIKAVALTLQQYPNLNASFSGDSVVHYGRKNIGVAVSVEGGLLTVVCKDADTKPLSQISNEMKAMAARARQGKVKTDDIEGSTFSLSNMGMYDVENFAAIINPPEAAILAVGSAVQVAVVEDGKLVPGWRMKATISVDHRISDGVEAAKFMQALAGFLEEPLKLLI